MNALETFYERNNLNKYLNDGVDVVNGKLFLDFETLLKKGIISYDPNAAGVRLKYYIKSNNKIIAYLKEDYKEDESIAEHLALRIIEKLGYKTADTYPAIINIDKEKAPAVMSINLGLDKKYKKLFKLEDLVDSVPYIDYSSNSIYFKILRWGRNVACRFSDVSNDFLSELRANIVIDYILGNTDRSVYNNLLFYEYTNKDKDFREICVAPNIDMGAAFELYYTIADEKRNDNTFKTMTSTEMDSYFRKNYKPNIYITNKNLYVEDSSRYTYFIGDVAKCAIDNEKIYSVVKRLSDDLFDETIEEVQSSGLTIPENHKDYAHAIKFKSNLILNIVDRILENGNHSCIDMLTPEMDK